MTVSKWVSCAGTCALVAGVAALTAGPASATTDGCAPSERTVVSQLGSPTYSSIGSAAGKYNASPSTSSLHYTLSLTTKRATSWTGTAKASVGWGIAEVEASTSYNVTNETTTGRSVTDDLSVPGKYYGYDAPKVEYRTFHIYDQNLNPTCTWVTTKDYGYLKAITAYPFFSSCVSKSACTPKP